MKWNGHSLFITKFKYQSDREKSDYKYKVEVYIRSQLLSCQNVLRCVNLVGDSWHQI